MNRKIFPSIALLIFLTASGLASDKPLNQNDTAAKEAISDNMFNDNIKPSQDGTNNVTQEMTGKNLAGASVSSKSSQPKTRLLSPSNTWSLDLTDSLDRTVELQMSQSENVVYGKGTIVIGENVQTATATGTIDGKKLNLDILSDDLTLFRLSLIMNGKSISGDYHGYSTKYVPWKGIAMGKIN